MGDIARHLQHSKKNLYPTLQHERKGPSSSYTSSIVLNVSRTDPDNELSGKSFFEYHETKSEFKIL